MFVMMTFGGSMVIATLLAAVRNRGDGRWAMAGCCASSGEACHVCLMEDPDEDDPDDNACHVSLVSVALLCFCGLGFLVGVESRFRFNFGLKMSSKKKAASSARVGDAHEKSTDKLSLNKIPSSSPRNNSTRGSGSPAGIVHGIPPFHQDSTRLHSSQYPGADGMQHHQHAVQPRPHAVEVFFVYSLKKAKTDIFSLSAHLPSLQLVTNCQTRRREGRRDSDGPGCVGGVEASGEALLSKLLLSDSGRQGEAVQDAADCAEPDGGRPGAQEYVINILPRKMPKEVVPGEHYTVKDLPIYQALKRLTLKNAERSWTIGRRRKTKGPFGRLPDRNAAQTLLQIKLQRKEEAGEEWEGSEGAHSSQRICSSANYHEAEVIIEEPVNPAPHSISSAASINHPDSPNPDVDAVEAVCATPMEEAGQKARVSPRSGPLALVLVKGPPSKRPRFGAQSEVRTPRAASRSSARDRS
ncbi:hypothetical protein CK203_087977 [Vitis vinifera]|uniref:Uncharacterized protein n=1 Tax=Vitis vinifera TaxID=29760 RepID=A0A438D7U7_VITVI|nr:hypothetical protein CK203_087977 [Vitis vinifera]